MKTPKMTSHAALLHEAGRLSGVCALLRGERELLPQDDAYLWRAASLEECVLLEHAVTLLEGIAARRS